MKTKTKIPTMIYGTAWKKDATAQFTNMAIELGFNAIDTANQPKHYQEGLVGETLQALYQQGIKRETLFLQTKFTPLDGHDHRIPYDPEADLTTQVQQSFASSLEHLHTDFLDCYLLHGPYSYPDLGPEDWQVWTAIEEIYQSGKAKLIGISNVNSQQLEMLYNKAKIKPMVVQNRCYANRGWDKAVREFCMASDIIYQGFSLLTANQQVLIHPKVQQIAKRLNKTSEQVVLRFAQQVNIVPLTGTTNMQHMKDDLAIERFELSTEEVRTIENIAV